MKKNTVLFCLFFVLILAGCDPYAYHMKGTWRVDLVFNNDTLSSTFGGAGNTPLTLELGTINIKDQYTYESQNFTFRGGHDSGTPMDDPFEIRLKPNTKIDYSALRYYRPKFDPRIQKESYSVAEITEREEFQITEVIVEEFKAVFNPEKDSKSENNKIKQTYPHYANFKDFKSADASYSLRIKYNQRGLIYDARMKCDVTDFYTRVSGSKFSGSVGYALKNDMVYDSYYHYGGAISRIQADSPLVMTLTRID